MSTQSMLVVTATIACQPRARSHLKHESAHQRSFRPACAVPETHQQSKFSEFLTHAMPTSALCAETCECRSATFCSGRVAASRSRRAALGLAVSTIACVPLVRNQREYQT